jgi:hypothetical protein
MQALPGLFIESIVLEVIFVCDESWCREYLMAKSESTRRLGVSDAYPLTETLIGGDLAVCKAELRRSDGVDNAAEVTLNE